MTKNNLHTQTLLYQLIFLHSQTHNKLFLDMAQTALKDGADINQANEDGETPLHLATRLENKDAFRFLIKNGANRFARTKNGETIADLCYQQTINQMAKATKIFSHTSHPRTANIRLQQPIVR